MYHIAVIGYVTLELPGITMYHIAVVGYIQWSVAIVQWSVAVQLIVCKDLSLR